MDLLKQKLSGRGGVAYELLESLEELYLERRNESLVSG